MDDGFGDGVLGQLQCVIAWDACGRGIQRPTLLAKLDEDVAGHDPRPHHREAVLDQRICDATPRCALEPLDRQAQHQGRVCLQRRHLPRDKPAGAPRRRPYGGGVDLPRRLASFTPIFVPAESWVREWEIAAAEGGGEPESVSGVLLFVEHGRAEVRTQLLESEQGVFDYLEIGNVALASVPEEPTFPWSLTVSTRTMNVPVDAEMVPFTVYESDAVWVAIADYGGRTIRVAGEPQMQDGCALVSANPAELEAGRFRRPN